MKYLIGLKEHHNYFDYDILREYYDRAIKLLGIQLVKEIRQIDSNKVLLKQFAETHQSFKNQR